MKLLEKEAYRTRLVAEVEALNDEIRALMRAPMSRTQAEFREQISEHQRLLDEVGKRAELLREFFPVGLTAEERAAAEVEKAGRKLH